MALQPHRVLKVVAYITRSDELLVFHHRDVPLTQAGLQVPAGTVRPGEPVAEAALREAVEETGLDDLVPTGYLGTADYDMRPYRHEIHERHFFHYQAPECLPDGWLWHEAHDGAEPPTALSIWWLPLRDGHVLAAGLGAMLGRLSSQHVVAQRSGIRR